MASPIPGFYTSAGGAITTHDFGSVEAGQYSPDSTGWSFRLYNAYGSTGSDDMTSVKVSVRGSSGGTDETFVEQHWIQIKSSSGSTGVVDDAQTLFTPVGKYKELSLGDIPSGEYRTLYARCYPPTDAVTQNISFKLRATCQQPATPISSWITGLAGQGIVYTTGYPFLTSTGGTTDGTIPYNDGYALIYNNEVYYGSSGSYTVSATGDGTYSLYLDESGNFGETTGDIESNQLLLAEFVTTDGMVRSLTDKRVFLGNVKAGLDDSKSSNPKVGEIYLATDTSGAYHCYAPGTWTEIGAGSGNVSSTEALNAKVIPKATISGTLENSNLIEETDGSLFLSSGNYTFRETAITQTTNTATIDWADSPVVAFVRTSDTPLTLAFVPPSGSAFLSIIFTSIAEDSSTGITFPGNISWKGGVVPTFATEALTIQKVDFYYSTGSGMYFGWYTTDTYSTV